MLQALKRRLALLLVLVLLVQSVTPAFATETADTDVEEPVQLEEIIPSDDVTAEAPEQLEGEVTPDALETDSATEPDLTEQIGTVEVTLDNYVDGSRLVRKAETNTGDFAADAVYYQFDSTGVAVDAAIVVGGSVRSKTITGAVTYQTMKDIHTFGNSNCVVTVTGQQLLDALEWGVRKLPDGETGGFLQVSGLRYQVDTTVPSTVQSDASGIWAGAPTGEYRVKDVKVYNKSTGGWNALDVTKQYNVAGTSYTLCDLGDGFAMFDGATVVAEDATTDYMVLANYVKAFPNGKVQATNSPLNDEYAGFEIDYSAVTGDGRIKVLSEEGGETSPALQIVEQTLTAEGEEGTFIEIWVTATGTDLSYQWYYAAPGSDDFTAYDIAGNNARFDKHMVLEENGGRFYCVVTDGTGASVSSDYITLAVIENTTPAIEFLTQPQEKIVAEVGQTVTVSVEAVCQGAELTYQWYYSNDGGKSFVKAEGCTEPTYTVVMDESCDGLVLHCHLYNGYYGQNTLDSTLYLPDTKVVLGSGSCGEGVTWSLNGIGKLTISGTGAMEDYFVIYDDESWNTLDKPWKKWRNEITEIVVEEGVTHIGGFAFGSPNLEKVTLPQSLQSIGRSCLSACSKVTSIELPAGLITIGDRAFAECDGLTEIVIPGSVQTIGTDAFYYCRGLKSLVLQEGITKLGDSAFNGCEALVSVQLPDTLKTVDTGAFRNCYSLREVTIPEGVTEIGEEAFTDSGLMSVSLPSTLKTIGWAAFKFCDNLKQVTIPASVTTIYQGAFSACDGLEEVRFEGNCPEIVYTATDTSRQEAPFGVSCAVAYYDKGATGFTSAKKTAMGKYLRWGVPGTVEIVCQPNNVTVQENELAVVTLEAKGEGTLTYTWYYAAADSDAFKKTTTFTGPEYSVTMNADRDGRRIWCLVTDEDGNTMPTDIVTLTMGVASTVNIVTQPRSVAAAIGQTASTTVSATGDGLTYTWYCAAPGSSEYVQDTAATGATYSVTMSAELDGSRVYCVVGDAYGNEEKTSAVTLSVANDEDGETTSFYYTEENGTITITGYNGDVPSELVIPDTIDGKPVTAIGYDAFAGKTTMERVTLGKNVTTIGDTAFYWCENLREVSLNDGLQTIGWGAFAVCSALEEICIPATVTEMAEAFVDAPNLYAIYVDENNATYSDIDGVLFNKSGKELLFFPGGRYGSYAVPDGVESIADAAFSCCNLWEIVLPDSVKSVGRSAFAYAANLTYAYLGSGVTDLAYRAFAYCYSLWSVELGENLVSIDEAAFYENISLRDVALPSTLESVGGDAFYNIHQNDLRVPQSVTTIGERAFGYGWINDYDEDGRYDDFVIYGVPGSAAETYADANGFGFIDESTVHFHEFGEWFEDPVPSCEHGGSMVRECVTCGHREGYRVPALGHEFMDGECIRCGAKPGLAYWVDDGDNAIVYGYHGEIPVDLMIPEELDGHTVTVIESESFMNAAGLTYLTLPTTLTTIGEGAFAWTGLAEVTIPAGVNFIGEDAFINNTLKSIYVDENNSAYSSNDGVLFNKSGNKLLLMPYGRPGTYEVPAGTKTIGEKAFSNGSLYGVVMPDSVTKVGEYAFQDAATLAYVTLGNGVTDLAYGTFYWCTNLRQVTLPETLVSIDKAAFCFAENLEEINFPESLQSVGANAFLHSLRADVTIPANVTTIGDYAFGYEWMNQLPIEGYVIYGEAGTEAEAYAKRNSFSFNGEAPHQHELGEFTESRAPGCTIPGEMESVCECGYRETYLTEALGGHEFSGGVCTNCGVPEGMEYELLDDNTIRITYYYGAGHVTVPAYIEGCPVTVIGESSFERNPELTGVTLPETLRELEYQAFCECFGLTEVVIPDSVEIVGWNAFYGCENLEKVTLGSGVTEIGHAAFLNCWNLTELVLPAGLETIGEYTFEACSGLEKITFLGDAPAMGEGCFQRIAPVVYYPCSNDTWTEDVMGNYGGDPVWVPDHKVVNGSCTDCGIAEGDIKPVGTQWKLVDGVLTISGGAMKNYDPEKDILTPWWSKMDEITKVVIEEGVTHVGNYAFCDFCALTEVELPSTLESIGEYAFANSMLQSIEFPAGLQTIGRCAFLYSRLTDITIPASVTQIGERAFARCSDLNSITVDKANTAYCSDAKGVLYNKAMTQLLQAPSALEGAYTVPEGVVSIAPDAFNSVGITEVTLPESLRAIGDYAFANSMLQSVEIGAKVESIGFGPFSGAMNLQSITVDAANPNYSNDAYGVLFNKDKTELLQAPGALLGSYTVPDSVVYIGNEAFYCCFGLLKLTIPGSVKEIGDYAISTCINLKRVELSKGLEVIGDGAFAFNMALSSVDIPEGVVAIGNDAFYWNDALRQVTVPGSVEVIGDGAFGGNAKLERVVFTGDAPEYMGQYLFIEDTVTVLTPCDNKTWTSAVKQSYGGSVTWGDYHREYTVKSTVKVTCTSDGYTKGTCKLCGESFTGNYVISAGHDEEILPGKAPTCTENGLDIGLICSVCDTVVLEQEVIPALGHNVVDGTCTRCGAQAAQITKQPEDVIVAEGEKAKVTVEAKGDGLTYAWYWAPAGSDEFKLTESFKTNTYEITMDASRNGRQVYCEITDQFGNTNRTRTATLSMRTALVITQQPQSQRVPEGQLVQVEVAAKGDGLHYEWFVADGEGNFVTTENTSELYAFIMEPAADGMQLYCRITDQYGNKVDSDVVTMTMAQGLAITKQPQSVTVNEGDTAKVAVEAVGEGLSYAWYWAPADSSDFTLTTSFKTNTYEITMTEDRAGRQVYCEITDQYGNKVTTDTVVLGMHYELTITKQPTDVRVIQGDTAKVTVAASGKELTYAWYWAAPGSDDFAKASIKTATYSVEMTAARDGRRVYCEITDKYGNKVTTDTVTLSMIPAPQIVTQPVDVTVDAGQEARVSVVATGEGELTYTWYWAKADSSTFKATDAFKTNEYFIDMNADRAGRQVYCVVTDQYGQTATTDTVVLGMNAKLVITQQPTDVTVANGKTAKVTVTAEGLGDVKYAWYWAAPGSDDFALTTSFTSNSYSITMNEARDGRRVYCVVTDKYGNKVQSDTVTLSMIPAPQIVTQPVDVTVDAGQEARVSVEAVGAGELTYTWYWAKADSSTFKATDAFKTNEYFIDMNADRAGRQVYCVVTDQYGQTARTETVTLGMNAKLVITQQPTDVTVANGKTAKVTVTAEGLGELKYAWYWAAPGSDDFALTTSFTSNSYSVTMNDSRDGRRVYCEISDKYGNKVTTDTVTLSMIPAPQIVTQPVDVTVDAGQEARVSVEAVGAGELTYTWYWAKADSSTFKATDAFKTNEYFIDMNADRAGRQVYCVVTDQYGQTARTETVTLGMNAKLVITQQPTDVTVANGKAAKVTVTAEGLGELKYAWYWAAPGSDDFALTTSFKSNSYSVTMNEDRDGRRVYCEISDKYGNKVTTDIVTLSMAAKPVITVEPTYAYALKGETATVSLVAEGEGLIYTWYWAKAGSSTYKATDAFDGPEYKVEMDDSRAGRKVYCVVTDKYGQTVRSETVTLRMQLNITEDLTDVTVASGKKASVTVKADGQGLKYAWYYSDGGEFKLTTSFKTATYSITMNEARAGRQVFCRITDKYGNTVDTAIATLGMK